MGRTTISAALAICVAGCAAIAAFPPLAHASPRDLAATQSYLDANYAMLRSAHALQGRSDGAIKGLLSQVQRECPAAAVESPQNTDSEQLSNELVGEMIIAGTRPVSRAIARYARAVSGLRWSNGRLTRAIRTYARQLSSLAKMAAPNLCADVRSWVDSRYQTLPASTVAFNSSYKAVNVPIGELPEALLAPYERPGQTGLLGRIRRLETSAADFEARAVSTYGEIMNALVLQP
jgi:hypothetical protein